MAAKKAQKTFEYGTPPKTLEDHPFYGLELNDEQKAFVEAKGIRYVTSSRIPHGNLPERSTTSIRQTLNK